MTHSEVLNKIGDQNVMPDRPLHKVIGKGRHYRHFVRGYFCCSLLPTNSNQAREVISYLKSKGKYTHLSNLASKELEQFLNQEKLHGDYFIQKSVRGNKKIQLTDKGIEILIQAIKTKFLK